MANPSCSKQSYRQCLPIIFLALANGACVSTPEPHNLNALVEEQQPLSVEPAIDFNRLNYEAALNALKTNEVDFAIVLLERVGKRSPDMDYVFTNLGLAYLKKENYHKAEESLQKAIRQNGKDAIALNHLGIIKRIQGQFEGARETYQQAIALDNGYAHAYLNLGILYDIYLQDLDMALGHYQKYQILTDSENKTVSKWIVDIERRIKSLKTKTKG